jgi:hypothetical protein
MGKQQRSICSQPVEFQPRRLAYWQRDADLTLFERRFRSAWWPLYDGKPDVSDLQHRLKECALARDG